MKTWTTDPATAFEARRSTDGHGAPAEPWAGSAPSVTDAVSNLESAVTDLLAATAAPLGPADTPAGALSRLVGVLDRATAAAVGLAGHAGTGADAASREKMGVEALLAITARQTSGDRRTLVTAAETLPSMPNVTTLFRDGVLSWGEVRAIVYAAARLTAEGRERIDAAFCDRDTVARMGADGVLGELDRIQALLDPAADDRAEQRAFEGNRLVFQPRLEGGGRGWFDYDGESFETLASAVDAAAGPPGAADTEGMGETEARWARQKARSVERADALIDIARTWLAGREGTTPSSGNGGDRDCASGGDSRGDSGRPARATMHVLIDIRDLIDDPDQTGFAWGLYRTGRRGPVRITKAAAARLACDADLRVVLMDGPVPLGVAELSRQIPALLRVALNVRDRGCRWPGCGQPVQHCDAHHVCGWCTGEAETELEELVLLCRRHHRQVHLGWTTQIQPDATVVFTRGRRRLETHPHGTLHLDLPDRPPNTTHPRAGPGPPSA